MKLRWLKAAQLLFAVLILCAPVLKTVTRTGVQTSVWFYAFELLCIGTLLVCRRLYRCPHCKKQLELNHKHHCPHCRQPLDE